MKYIFQIVFLLVLFAHCGKTTVEIQKVETAVLMVSAKTLNISAENGSASIDLSANVAWTASSNQTWLTISKSSGSGNDNISVSASANTATSARSATVTIIGTGVSTQTITVTQGGILSVLTVSANSLNVSAVDASTATFDISANVAWTANSNQTWLTISNLSGTGNQKITLTAAGNTAVTSRSATVTISGQGVTSQTVTVSQQGSSPFLTVSANTLSINSSAASTGTFDISANVAWTASSSQAWLAVSNLSGALNSVGEYAKALEVGEEAIAKRPELAEPHFNMGIMLLQRGEFKT